MATYHPCRLTLENELKPDSFLLLHHRITKQITQIPSLVFHLINPLLNKHLTNASVHELPQDVFPMLGNYRIFNTCY